MVIDDPSPGFNTNEQRCDQHTHDAFHANGRVALKHARSLKGTYVRSGPNTHCWMENQPTSRGLYTYIYNKDSLSKVG